MQAFFDTFSRYIQSTDTLILAVSGGVDSMVLFDIIKKHHPKKNIIVAHFDHSLRGVESDGDRQLVEDMCRQSDIICEIKKENIGQMAKEERFSLEAIARRERYKFLEAIRTKYAAKYILTAHHRGDQTETILMNLIKGGKMKGLSGMQVLSNNIFRPLLTVSKAEIKNYARKNTTLYREDSTNQDIDYTRNNIRHNIIPLLEDINPAIHETLTDLGGYMQELTVFFREYTEKWLQNTERVSGNENSFLISDFSLLSNFVQREVVSTLYTIAHGGTTQGLSRGMIVEIVRFITEGSNSYGIKEIKKLRLERRGERIYY